MCLPISLKLNYTVNLSGKYLFKHIMITLEDFFLLKQLFQISIANVFK